MTNEAEVEERLTASMRDHVTGISLDPRILSRAGKRHQRRKVLWRGGFGAGLVSVAVIVAFAVSNGGAGVRPEVREDSTLAQAHLVAAVTASQGTSFLVTIKVRRSSDLEKLNRDMTLVGAYDPAANSGYLRIGDLEERIVNGVRYLLVNGTVKEVPMFKTDPSLFQWPGGQGFLGTVVDPKMLLESLRQQDAKITETGPGAFHFELTSSREIPNGTSTASFIGDLTVGADNRVARISYKTMVSSRTTAEIVTDMEFSGYGTPVKVQLP